MEQDTYRRRQKQQDLEKPTYLPPSKFRFSHATLEFLCEPFQSYDGLMASHEALSAEVLDFLIPEVTQFTQDRDGVSAKDRGKQDVIQFFQD